MYYNTTGLKDPELGERKDKAKSQDEIILELFKTFSELNLTPERLLSYLQDTDKRWSNTPITSVRRSFSNLSKRGLIRKTGQLVNGSYGAKIHTWKLEK